MAISITGPDGSTFDFPDGTDSAVISGAMQKHYGKPKAAAPMPSGEAPEVSAIRQQFRDQGPVKIASGNLMGLTDEINSAGAAGIDRLLGRTDDWNERRKAYRAAFKQERAAAEKELGGVGTFAADFVGGMAAAPFKFASQTAPAVSALPLPTMGKLTPMVEAKTATQAVVNPIANTIQNLPPLLKTGAVYGGVGGFIGSPEDDLSSRTRNAAYSGAAGAAFMPALHLGISGAASVAPGIAGTARNAFERMTGTTPQQRQAAAERMDELIAAGVRPEEIYGPMLRPEGGTWLSRSIANSPGGYQRSANAAERHIAALERQLGNEIEQTGAPRHPFTAASERQAFLDRQVNQYSRTPESIQFAADDELARMADPLTGHLRRPPEPPPPGASGGPSPGGPTPPSPQAPPQAPRGPDILQAYNNARRLRYERKLPAPDNYFSNEEASALTDMWRYTKERIQKPETLVNWIIRNGGVRDPGGDIAAMLGKANMRPGLINNKSGMHPDAMTRHAWESGFIDSVDRPTINQLFGLVSDDLSGRMVVRSAEQSLLDDLLTQQQMREELAQYGLSGARSEAELQSLLKRPLARGERPSQPAQEDPGSLIKPVDDNYSYRRMASEDPAGPRAEDAPGFLKRFRPMRKELPPPQQQAVAPAQAREPYAPGRDVGQPRPQAGMDGDIMPPPPPEQPRLPPPRDEGIPYDPTLTDKDRVAAMYEQQNRLIPGQARGGMGTARLPHTRDKNIGALVEDIRRNARAEGRLIGDDASKSFLDSAAADQIEREVRRHLPSDLVTSLFNREGVGPAPRQMMRYRTAVRDADSSNPMMRTTTQTWLPRAEAALTQDIEARLASLKDGGEALAHWQNSNRQYAAWKEQNVAPLKTIVGENVKPEQALDRLTAAMKGKDLTMIRAYAEAHRRGDSAKVGAGALVSHMMEGGLSNFVQQYSAFSPAAKAALFSGKAAELGKSLDRFAKLAEPAVQARERMNWKGLNMHSGIVGTSIIVHNITATMTAVLGQYGIARFMSSPAYVNWITRAAHAVQRGGQSAWRNQLMLLGQVANSDDPEFGKQVVKSVSDVLTPQKARAMEMAE